MPSDPAEPSFRLDAIAERPDPRGLVVLLHGGQEASRDRVQNRHASWWRMALLGRSLEGFAQREHLGLALVQNRYRGWNDPHNPDPVRDARDALHQVAEEHPNVPLVLVGHSMGGRTACRVADHPAVAGIVGLAPWLPDGEPVGAIAGRNLHVIHGTRDRWTSPSASRRYVERAEPIARAATWESLPGVGHFMFRRVSRWRQFMEQGVRASLSPAPSRERRRPDRSPPR